MLKWLRSIRDFHCVIELVKKTLPFVVSLVVFSQTARARLNGASLPPRWTLQIGQRPYVHISLERKRVALLLINRAIPARRNERVQKKTIITSFFMFD